MKKILLIIIAPIIFLSALSAQITRKEADRIVIERMSREKPPYVIYERGSDLYDFWPGCELCEPQLPEPNGISVGKGMSLELSYPCWLYFVRYSNRVGDQSAPCRYLIVNGNNGNLLEIKIKDDFVPEMMMNSQVVQWVNVATSCDCEDELYYYYGEDWTRSPVKLSLGRHFVNDYLLVAFMPGVQNSEIKNFLDNTGFFNPVDTAKIEPTRFFWFPGLPVNTKEQKTCSHLKEIISTLEQSPLVAYASLAFEQRWNRCGYDLENTPRSNYDAWAYTNLFNVRLKRPDYNLADLEALLVETNTRIYSYSSTFDNYTIIVDKNSKGNALQMSQYFYETGKFFYAEALFRLLLIDRF